MEFNRVNRTVALIILSLTILPPVLVSSVHATGASQIVFSCTSSPPCNANGNWVTSGDTAFGFWYWCQASSSTGAYGFDCAGSIYIYGVQLPAVAASCITTTQVKCVTQNIDGSYTLIANGRNGWACTLTNETPVTSGATNIVVMKCKTPSGTGTANGAVVRVT